LQPAVKTSFSGVEVGHAHHVGAVMITPSNVSVPALLGVDGDG
jgi:hypothetical protein